MIDKAIYRKQHTYLVIENETGEYVRWETPNKETLFLGAYDCRYRVTRLTLTPRTGEGKSTR